MKMHRLELLQVVLSCAGCLDAWWI